MADDLPTLVHENRGPSGVSRDFGVVRLYYGEKLLGTWKVATEDDLSAALREVSVAVRVERARLEAAAIAGWCAERGCDHVHCAHACEHPQPFLDGGVLYCGRCNAYGTRTAMVPCVPETCADARPRTPPPGRRDQAPTPLI